MLPICNILVPSPCATSPPTLFSRKLAQANPTICAQQPATAAPPASPVRPMEAHIAALLTGSVRSIPTITETMIPITNGCCVVAHIISLPNSFAKLPIGGAINMASSPPTRTVTAGVRIISIFVFPASRFARTAAMRAITKTARGPPAPPLTFAAYPTAAIENITSG